MSAAGAAAPEVAEAAGPW